MVGEYRITGILGRGGMGTVYSGIHPVIEKKVAIKVLTEYSGRSDAIDRFIQEARAANRIGHPNIVDIFSFGQLPDGRHYFVMEFVPGNPLTQFLREKAPLVFDEALPILRGIAEGLDAAHDKGIVHRDLKPDNVFVIERPGQALAVKILDFGIAKLITPEEASRSKTRTGTSMGTPLYMSPEQCRGDKEVDHRSDIYSFGVIAYMASTGRVPFDADSHVDVIYMHVHAPPPPPSVVSGVPLPLESIILRALAKRPDDRYQRLSHMLTDLQSLPDEVHSWQPSGRSDHNITPEASTRVNAQTPSYIRAPSSSLSSPRRSSRMLLAGIVGTLAVAAFAGWFVLKARHKPDIAEQVQASPTGRFVLVSDPSGAEVYINGQKHPETTPTDVTGVTRGQRTMIELRKPGYKPWSDRLSLALDEEKRVVNATLVLEAPPPGTLEVKTNVKQATFFLDGNKVGDKQSDLALKDIASGVHILRVEAKGYAPTDRTVQIVSNKVNPVEIKLEHTGKGGSSKPGGGSKDDTINPFGPK
jgi:serine/threonine protein kinase